MQIQQAIDEATQLRDSAQGALIDLEEDCEHLTLNARRSIEGIKARAAVAQASALAGLLALFVAAIEDDHRDD